MEVTLAGFHCHCDDNTGTRTILAHGKKLARNRGYPSSRPAVDVRKLKRTKLSN